MDATEYFYTCAEIGVALSGFAALVVAIGQRAGKETSQADIWYVGVLVERGLAAALFALLPMLLEGLGAGTRLNWLLSSGLFALYVISIAVRSLAMRKHVPAEELNDVMGSKVFLALLTVGLLVAGVQAVHASGYLLQQSPWWHALAVTWLLMSLGYMFMSFLRFTLREI